MFLKSILGLYIIKRFDDKITYMSARPYAVTLSYGCIDLVIAFRFKGCHHSK